MKKPWSRGEREKTGGRKWREEEEEEEEETGQKGRARERVKEMEERAEGKYSVVHRINTNSHNNANTVFVWRRSGGY